MIGRKRERATLESLEDLVRYMRNIREERKAILTVTEGWLLFRENPQMMRLRQDGDYTEPVPGVEPIRVGPSGKLTHKDKSNPDALTLTECNTDRMSLASLNNERFFRDLMDEANYANASFYPIDPRGLPAFDVPIGPDKPPGVIADHAMLRQRLEVMQTLAGNTDGMAVINSNDLDKGLRRISDDLTSYYLLGYYASNAKLDGRFRALKVRVKQPGVEVRARRGYKAATEAEVTAARAAADAPVPEETLAVTAALGTLARIRPDARFRINAAPGSTGDTLWVAGELAPPSGKPDEFELGANVDIEVIVGAQTTTARVPLKPRERTFLTSIKMPAPATKTFDVRARLSATESGVLPLSDSLKMETTRQPLLFRRGIATANRWLPAADFRFSRTERIRVEVPVGADVKAGAGRVLDRTGKPLPLTVTVAERVDESQRWITAEVGLAALSNGDYAIELELTGPATERILTAIRLVR